MNHYKRCSPREPEASSQQEGLPLRDSPPVQAPKTLGERSGSNSPGLDELPKPGGSRRSCGTKLSQQRFLSNVPEESKGLNFQYRFVVLGKASERILRTLAPDLPGLKEISITTEVPQDLDGHDPFDVASYVSLANQAIPRPRGSVHSSLSSQSDSVGRKIAKVRLSAALTFSDDVPQNPTFADACNSAAIFVLHLPQSEQPEAKEGLEEQVSLLQTFSQQYFFQKKRLQASLNCLLVLGGDEQSQEVPEEIRQLTVQHRLPVVFVQAHTNMTEVFARISALIPSWADLKEQEEPASPSALEGKKVKRGKSLVGRVLETVGEGFKSPGAFFGRKRSVESISSTESGSGTADTSSRRGSG